MTEEAVEPTIDDQIAAVVQPLKDLDDELARREAHTINELEEIRDKRKRLLGMLRNADPENYKPKSYKQKAPERIAYGHAIIETYIAARQVIAEIGVEDEFSAEDVWSKLERPENVSVSMQKDRVNKVLNKLREEGRVRLVGTKKGRGGGNSYRATERIFDEVPVEAAANGST